ncbi:MAG: hypothetical protein NUV67_03035 [archaeon]|nr:hypothetical protein [archaeon]
MLEGFGVTSVPSYLESLLSNAFAGDPGAIVIFAILAVIAIALVFTVSSFLFVLVRKGFLLIIVLLSAFYFLSNYGELILSGQADISILALGAIGFVFALFALYISLTSFGKHVAKGHDPYAPAYTPTQLQQPKSYTSQALTKENLMNSLSDDRSILAVLSYVIIAQFGVFSGVTISAPNVNIGLVFFAVFVVGALIFIKTTYHDYKKGLIHLAVASAFGLVLSIMLGHFWAEMPLETLLSIGYFATDAMVAFVTGIAVSLLMGTKH